MASGIDTYSYDANGSLISKTVNSVTTNFTWDVINRLVEFDDGTTEASWS
jgi:hypothetical protein